MQLSGNFPQITFLSFLSQILGLSVKLQKVEKKQPVNNIWTTGEHLTNIGWDNGGNIKCNVSYQSASKQ